MQPRRGEERTQIHSGENSGQGKQECDCCRLDRAEEMGQSHQVGTGGGSESCLQHPGNQRAPWNVKTGLHLTARRREAGRTGIGPQVQLQRQGEELLVSLELHPDSFHHSLLFSLV